MLTRSVAAVLCGALAVAALPGTAEQVQIVEPWDSYAFQETLEGPQWSDEASDEVVVPEEFLYDPPSRVPHDGGAEVVVDDEHPYYPAPPRVPHHGGHGEHGFENKTIYQALKEDTRYASTGKCVGIVN